MGPEKEGPCHMKYRIGPSWSLGRNPRQCHLGLLPSLSCGLTDDPGGLVLVFGIREVPAPVGGLRDSGLKEPGAAQGKESPTSGGARFGK